MYIIKYDGKKIGKVVSNRSLTDQEAIELAGINLEGLDPYGEPWDWELFEVEYK